MRLRIEATADELKEKAPDLVKAVAAQLESVDPDLAENLLKALPRKEPVLKYPALRSLQKAAGDAYASSLISMVSDIEKTLTGPMTKSERPLVKGLVDGQVDKEAAGYEMAYLPEEACARCKWFELRGKAVCAKVHGTILPEMTCMLWEAHEIKKADQRTNDTEDDPDYDSETGEPIFNPTTGETPSEEAAAKEAGEVEEEEAVKASDYTEAIVAAEYQGYRRIQNMLKRKGYTDADFTEGGKLYGQSANELRSLI